VSFSRLVAKEKSSGSVERLTVKSEKNWLAPIDKFNAIFSTSQTQFASLFPEQSEVNQSGLVQKPINEDDYRLYIKLYSEIKGKGNYSAESLNQLESILTRSPYLYAAYGLYRETASNLYSDTRDKTHLEKLELLLQNSPPEYRYSIYHAIDSFWMAYKMKNLDNAQQQIIEAKSKGASSFVLAELNAILYFSKGQYQKAADTFQEAITLRSSTALFYNLAFSYWRLGDLTKTEIALNQMLKIVPDNYKARRLQANIWLLQGKLELAIMAYERVVESLNNGRDLTNLSLAYGLNKQYKKSLEFAQLALKKNPKHPTKLLNLADIEMILGKRETAISHYQQVIAILSGEEEVKNLTNLAQAYAQLSQADLAIAALSKAQNLASEGGEASYSFAIVYSLLKEEASAIHHVKSALKSNVGVVWFNLPWFDKLCDNKEFSVLMTKYQNVERCKI
jgi:serine/threonine-protein kinase